MEPGKLLLTKAAIGNAHEQGEVRAPNSALAFLIYYLRSVNLKTVKIVNTYSQASRR
jgi:hypothetical protein